jgi:tetratricopeptide (TPR) repeat protein
MRFGPSSPRYVASVLTLFLIGCSSRSAPKESQSLSSSTQQGKPAAPASSPTGDSVAKPTEGNDQGISYAKNPQRFVKMETTEPVFNITDPKTAQEHFNVAVNDDHDQQIDQAIAEYQKALELKPDWALAHFRLAQDYQKQGRTDDAIAHWTQATRYDPQFYSAYDLLAGAYQRQGNLKKAIEAYSALLRYPPAQMAAHYQLGLWYANLGDRPKAREHLEAYRDLAVKISAESNSDRFQKALRELRTLKP